MATGTVAAVAEYYTGAGNLSLQKTSALLPPFDQRTALPRDVSTPPAWLTSDKTAPQAAPEKRLGFHLPDQPLAILSIVVSHAYTVFRSAISAVLIGTHEHLLAIKPGQSHMTVLSPLDLAQTDSHTHINHQIQRYRLPTGES